MGIFFNGTNDVHCAEGLPPNTGPVAVFGCWFRPTAAQNANGIMAIAGSSQNDNINLVAKTSGANDAISVINQTGLTTVEVLLDSNEYENSWFFVVVQQRSTATWQMGLLRHGSGKGLLYQSSSAYSGVPYTNAIIGNAYNGMTNSFVGIIAEWFIADQEVPLDIASTMFQLAYGGPFSVFSPRNINIYESLRQGLNNGRSSFGSESYYRESDPVAWTNASAQLGMHPPLPYWYQRPGQHKLVLPI